MQTPNHSDSKKKINQYTGTVMAQRYQVGDIFYESKKEGLVVYRVEDKLLELDCFAMVTKENHLDALLDFVQGLISVNEFKEDYVVVQAIKQIEGMYILFFSMKDRDMKKDAFKTLLRFSSEKREALRDVDHEAAKSGIQNEEMLPIGSKIDGKYVVVECIGIGGFGITYLCKDIYLHRMVAVKEYYPSQWAQREDSYVSIKSANAVQAYQFGMRSFLSEARTMANYIHTYHAVTLYDCFECNDTIYIVMKFVPGVSLGRELRSRNYQPYDTKEVKQMIAPVLDVLQAMHQNQEIHSDISPGNIMLSGANQIYVIDFGATKKMNQKEIAFSNAFLKTDYAALEQFVAAKEGITNIQGPWTDVYALGATMYFMLTGKKLTDAIHRAQRPAEENETELKEVESVASKEWARLLGDMLQLDYKKRIQSISELQDRFNQID